MGNRFASLLMRQPVPAATELSLDLHQAGLPGQLQDIRKITIAMSRPRVTRHNPLSFIGNLQPIFPS